MEATKIIVITIISIFVVLIILFGYISAKDLSKQKKRNIKIVEKDKKYLVDLITSYGNISKEIKYGNSLEHKILVFEKPQIILINRKQYSFKDIIGFKINDNNQEIANSTIQRSSTTNVVGRAIVGGVLGGGVGALIGGSTAEKHTYSNTPNIFTVNIMVNSISNPNISIKIFNSGVIDQINALLTVIVERNKNNI